MSCSCHAKNGTPVNGTVRPDEQCLVCASKHIEMALTAWGEFTYEESNRRFVAGHLRLAVEHTKINWRDLALEIRDIATTIELATERSKTDIRDRLLDVQDLCLSKLHEDKPEITRRLNSLFNNGKVDIIIPLGNGSKVDNAELRILFRSIEAHVFDLGKIYLVTKYCPEWVNRENVEVVEIDDIYDDNKDANLHLKILETIKKYNIGEFVFCADDNAFLQDVRLGGLPTLHNGRGIDRFPADGSKWHQRMRHTFEFAKSRGVDLPYNFECHSPQLFDGQLLVKKMEDVDYVTLPGLTIYTTWRIVTDSWKHSVNQNAYKWTFELPMDETAKTISDGALTSKMFVGYSDSGVQAGIVERLLQHFPKQSRYEK